MTADRTEGTTVAAARWLALVALVLLAVVIALGVWVRDLSDDVHKLRSDVDDLHEFVDEQIEVTPDEAEQSAAIAEAVRIVPELRVILCEAFPDVPTCASGG